MTSKAALAACVLALWTLPQVPASPDVVVSRASAYLARYEAALSALVAEEEYTQKLAVRSIGPAVVGAGQTRRLISDFMLVKLTSDEPWTPFRDVISVDGKPVRDRDARL